MSHLDNPVTQPNGWLEWLDIAGFFFVRLATLGCLLCVLMGLVTWEPATLRWLAPATLVLVVADRLWVRRWDREIDRRDLPRRIERLEKDLGL